MGNKSLILSAKELAIKEVSDFLSSLDESHAIFVGVNEDFKRVSGWNWKPIKKWTKEDAKDVFLICIYAEDYLRGTLIARVHSDEKDRESDKKLRKRIIGFRHYFLGKSVFESVIENSTVLTLNSKGVLVR